MDGYREAANLKHQASNRFKARMNEILNGAESTGLEFPAFEF
jgi:hypothetical protein